MSTTRSSGATPTPSPTPSAGADDEAATAEVEALQSALAAEHAAVFVYGALGAQASQARQARLYRSLVAAYGVHRARRDELRTVLVARGITPAAAEAAYELPADLSTAQALRERALGVEQASAATYAYVVARTSGDLRRIALAGLLDAAVRGLSFGGAPQRLPGLPG